MGLKILILFNADDDLQSTSAANLSLDHCVKDCQGLSTKSV